MLEQMIKHLKKMVKARMFLYVVGKKLSKCVRTPLSLVVRWMDISNFPIWRDIFISKNENALLKPNNVNFISFLDIVINIFKQIQVFLLMGLLS